ncbi:MAG: chorismate synthase [Bdellovibrionia bacterium]
MSANSFGNRFKMLSFGESHGPALGVVVDGCPAGLKFDMQKLLHNLERRKPGQKGQTVSARAESDVPEILSGIFEGVTLGTPIAVMVRNQDARSQDYAEIKSTPRAGHADDVWQLKFGHRDYRGGGRSSGRETLSRVIAGSIAEQLCNQVYPQLKVIAYTSQVGSEVLTPEEESKVTEVKIDDFAARFPSANRGEKIAALLKSTQEQGNSLGGVATILVKSPPAGLGQPVFHKFKSDLAQALMSVGAVNGVELGAGFDAGSANGVQFHGGDTSVYGGIRGGISTGEDIVLKASFKPTSSLLDVAKKGRHDPFIVTRAIPVLESMVWMVLADHILWQLTDRVENLK